MENLKSKLKDCKSIHEAEDLIIELWSEQAKTNDVSSDGLHYLGDFYYKNGYWGREKGNEEEEWNKWCEDKRGLVIITKELNDNFAWDLRIDHFRKDGVETPQPNTQSKFCSNMRTWVYGLQNISTNGDMPDFPEISVSQHHFETAPWVRVNLKKTPGGSSISQQALSDTVNEYKTLLISQFELYDGASIYLDCANGSGLILLKDLYQDIKQFKSNGRVYFSPENKKIVIKSWHPSYPELWSDSSKRDYYNELARELKEFFSENPDFLN
ncbi:hypothetical protein [Ornithobacterium rhinotracheale]